MALHKVLPVAALLTLTVACVSCLPAHDVQKRSGMKLCGRMLVEALAAVCENEYYDPNQIHRKSQGGLDKRNFGLSAPDAADSYPSWESADPDGSLLDARTALTFLTNGQLPRGVRGVADECCRKSCSYNQLISYCGMPAARRK